MAHGQQRCWKDLNRDTPASDPPPPLPIGILPWSFGLGGFELKHSYLRHLFKTRHYFENSFLFSCHWSTVFHRSCGSEVCFLQVFTGVNWKTQTQLNSHLPLCFAIIRYSQCYCVEDYALWWVSHWLIFRCETDVWNRNIRKKNIAARRPCSLWTATCASCTKSVFLQQFNPKSLITGLR